jgi:hypothetical protein
MDHNRDVHFSGFAAILSIIRLIAGRSILCVAGILAAEPVSVVARETVAGDVAPRGNPDGVLNVGDLVVANRLLQGLISPAPDESLTCDVAPLGAPDGIFNAGDLSVLTRAALGMITLPPVMLPPLAPTINGIVNGQTYTVTGQAAPNLSINLYLNDNRQTVTRTDASGYFSANVSLSPGGNTIYASAEDAGGESPGSNVLDATLVGYTAGNPIDVSKIGKLEDRQYNNVASVHIKGNTGSVDAYAWVRVMTGNGQSETVQADQDGKFEIYVPGYLADGVSVVVVDAQGLTSGPVTLQNRAVGALTGEFQVSQSGAATFSIPIKVPPGTAGMQPNLAFSYNSQGGNTTLGTGWSLSGFSAVQRCPMNIAIEGVRDGVNFDANDRFCRRDGRLWRQRHRIPDRE